MASGRKKGEARSLCRGNGSSGVSRASYRCAWLEADAKGLGLRAGVLYLVATPIGNLNDISLRALALLRHADVIACEDTRTTSVLLRRFGIRRKGLLPYHEHNEPRAIRKIVELLKRGKSVAVCSDAGFPGISDPGYALVRAVLEGGIPVSVLPGPSAVETALLLSGLPTSSYTFRGFPPRKRGERMRFLEEDVRARHTLVYFESPRRLASFLDSALNVLGDRKAAVCVEMTKKFETVHRGWLSELSALFHGSVPRGEVAVVIAGLRRGFFRQKP